MSNCSTSISNQSLLKQFSYLDWFLIIVKLGLLAAWVVSMFLLLVIVKLVFRHQVDRVFMAFHAGCCRIFGLRVVVKGVCSAQTPTLFLANHLSYLDIFILGSVIPGYFVAKSDVSTWPIIGKLAKIQNTLFIERNPRQARAQMNMMSEHFNQLKNLILFPEGTSTEGAHVEPFKSSLLQAAEQSEQDVIIQPVAIAYTKSVDHKMSQAERDKLAWYGDMTFLSHFFGAMVAPVATIEVVFLAPQSIQKFESRKCCALDCQAQVSQTLEQLLNQ